MTKSISKDEILEWWDSQNSKFMRGSPQTIIRRAAQRFNVPEEVIRKHIGDWEAGG